MRSIVSLKLHFPKKEFVFLTGRDIPFPCFVAALPFVELQVERTFDSIDLLLQETLRH